METFYVIDHGEFWRVEFFVICSATLFMHQSSSDSLDEHVVINLKFKHSIQLGISNLKHFIELQIESDPWSYR